MNVVKIVSAADTRFTTPADGG
jgi:hypothetical protein